jgi:hypothetical protein
MLAAGLVQQVDQVLASLSASARVATATGSSSSTRSSPPGREEAKGRRPPTWNAWIRECFVLSLMRRAFIRRLSNLRTCVGRPDVVHLRDCRNRRPAPTRSGPSIDTTEAAVSLTMGTAMPAATGNAERLWKMTERSNVKTVETSLDRPGHSA